MTPEASQCSSRSRAHRREQPRASLASAREKGAGPKRPRSRASAARTAPAWSRWPGESLPAWAAALEPAEALEAHLRAWRVPILGRIHRGKLLLDVRTLLPGDEAEIAAALAAWREERA